VGRFRSDIYRIDSAHVVVFEYGDSSEACYKLDPSTSLADVHSTINCFLHNRRVAAVVGTEKVVSI
jgi:hypothetical protein